MNQNMECYYQSALNLYFSINPNIIPGGFVIALGKKRYFFYGHETPFNLSTSVQVSRDKYTVNEILKEAGFPVPKSVSIDINEFQNDMLDEVIDKLSFPLVVKPQTGAFGKNVLCNIQNREQLKNYLQELLLEYDYLLIQEFHANLKSYRVLVFNNRVIGVVLRYPAHVIGDGEHHIEELIELTNIERKKISDAIGPILIDTECKTKLIELGLDLNYIPQKNEWITLGYTSNASRGGSYTSLGNKICKENKRFFIRAAKALDLKLVGFDVECPDINTPIVNSNGVIIEANDAPNIRIHEKAMAGIRLPVTRKILRTLIFKHPFAYIHTLYYNAEASRYLRGGLALMCIGILCMLLDLIQ